MKDPELDRLERDAFRKYHEDGLLDFYLGFLLAAMPLAGILNDSLFSEAVSLLAYAAIVFAVAGLYVLLRRKLIRPRLGSFTPAPQRKRKINLVRLALAASVVLGLLVWWAFGAAADGLDTLQAFMPVIWLANALLVFGAMGYFLDLPRLYGYGVLFGLPLSLDTALNVYFSVDLPVAIVFVAPALVMIGVGSMKLARFLHDYPVRSSEVGCGSP